MTNGTDATLGDVVTTAADHVGVPREAIDRFLKTLQACGWHLAPVSERAAPADAEAKAFGEGVLAAAKRHRRRPKP